MSRKIRVSFVTVVPSPYQRDLFGALAAREELDLRVLYLEDESPDSPWPKIPLRVFERVLPGLWVSGGGARWHFNWSLPDFSGVDFVVLSSFTSWTGQWLMRRKLRNVRWLFWGERLRRQNTRLRQNVQRRLTAPLASATGIVGIGQAATATYREKFPDVRHFCIPYHCDLSAFEARAAKREAQKPFTFLFCGQMIRRKGVDLLLSAFERLVKEGFDARLSLVGREAELPGFLNQVSVGARSRIGYEGFQPPERLPEYFSRADVLVLPSRHDGWGVVVNQAIGAGLPVISSDAVGAGQDLVTPNVNGLLFESGNVEQLFQCLKRFASDAAFVAACGRAAREKARDLTPEAGAEKWVRVFRSLAEA